jgi:hypothetical protein
LSSRCASGAGAERQNFVKFPRNLAREDGKAYVRRSSAGHQIEITVGVKTLFRKTLIKFRKNKSRFLDFAELPRKRAIPLRQVMTASDLIRVSLDFSVAR